MKKNCDTCVMNKVYCDRCIRHPDYKLCFDYSVVLFFKTVKVTSIAIYVLLILLLISLNIIREIDYLYSTQLFLPLISIFIFLFNSVVIYGFCLNEETDNRKIWQE